MKSLTVFTVWEESLSLDAFSRIYLVAALDLGKQIWNLSFGAWLPEYVMGSILSLK